MSLTRIIEWLHKHSHILSRRLLWAILVIFIASVALYFLDTAFSLPLPDRFVPNSFLGTIIPPLSMLLIYELLALVLATGGSFVVFVQREFEIVSLILLRDLFKKLDDFQAGYQTDALVEIGIVAFGCILLYFFIEVVERISVHFVSGDLKEELPGNSKKQLRQFKDALEIGLIVSFVAILIYELASYVFGWQGSGLGTRFIELVFSALIIYCIALLLLVLVVNNRYEVLFEHSALILASVVVLIGLEAPVLIQIPLILASSMFVIATLFLHGFARGRSLRSMFSKIIAGSSNKT